ncbi:MAG: protein adenylyltransferase SelO family protein [Sphingomonas sp.]
MTDKPQPARYRAESAILELGPSFYDQVAAAPFPDTILRFRNDRAAREIGLETLTDAEWVEHFGRFRQLPGSLATPLALRYHGHQFGVYNDELGDGRGFLFAQARDDRDRLMDLGTKGSGQTPWSRRGDGRLTLKGGVREVLATEMLAALGVDTSRSFSLIETGEALERGDEPSPARAAVLVRLSHGHIRIGTFQRLAYLGDDTGLAKLTGYVLRHYFGDDDMGDDAPIRLLHHVVARTARLAAQLMAAGFVHGVLNTDNINVTGESFDYGPWRFLPSWDPNFVAAYFDHAGRYAFGRQPEAVHWSVMQLAGALRALAPPEALVEALDRFAEHYQRGVLDALLWRLGVLPRGLSDQAVVQALERGWRETAAPLDAFFHRSFGGIIPDAMGAPFAQARALLAPYRTRSTPSDPYWQGAPCSMLIDDVETIWSAIARHDDWAPFNAKISHVRAMGRALAAA